MAETLSTRLAPLRERIDEIDDELLALLNERARLAQDVGQIKEERDIDGPVLKPEREAQILQRLKATNPGPFTGEGIDAVWREVISTCRGLERVLRVAFLGPEGSFSEEAAFTHFGHFINPVRCHNFDDVFRRIEAGQADVGVVPVENSTEGAVNRTLDLLLNSSLKVLGERSIRVQHDLLAQTNDSSGLTRVMAHPQALAQCQDWLNRHYPQLARESASSNAEAAKVAATDASVAAIAGATAAQAWGLVALHQGIQDDPHNRTRFLIIGASDAEASGNDKTSLILAVPNRAGAVYEMLAPLAKHGVSMTRLESRPARTGQWEYYFYLDLLGHRNQPAVEQALLELKKQVAYFKLLGSYPRQGE